MLIVVKKNVYFDYLYVNDFLKILDYFIQNDGSYKSYNAGSGIRIDLKKVSDIVNKVSGKRSKIIIKTKGFGNEYTCNNNLLIKETGKIKFTTFENSIGELYEWYATNRDQWEEKYLED